MKNSEKTPKISSKIVNPVANNPRIAQVLKRRKIKRNPKQKLINSWSINERSDEENSLRYQTILDLRSKFTAKETAKRMGYRTVNHLTDMRNWYEGVYLPKKALEIEERAKHAALEITMKKVREEKMQLEKKITEQVGDFDVQKKEFIVRYKDFPYPAHICFDMGLDKEDSFDMWMKDPIFAKKIRQLNVLAEERILISMRNSGIGENEDGKVNPTAGMNYLKMSNPERYNPGSVAAKTSQAKGRMVEIRRGVGIMKPKAE